jgi:hypothetical protein
MLIVRGSGHELAELVVEHEGHVPDLAGLVELDLADADIGDAVVRRGAMDDETYWPAP